MMTGRWTWLLTLLGRRLWFRATLISLLAVASALVAFLIAPYLPEGLSASIGADSVDGILNILASSMLAVTTFSLSTMVAAYSAATGSVTPRATKLMVEDSTTQNVLATFIGSFLFSLVAIVTLAMEAYGERGRIVLFVVTILVIILIVITLLRWIDYLVRLGRVGETTDRVEDAAARAMKDRRDAPYLGGRPMTDAGTIPKHARKVRCERIGYVQHVDMKALQDAAENSNGEIYVEALPGTFLDGQRPLVRSTASPAEDAAIMQAFSVGRERSFDQDPRFGLSVLAEIASRALSPGINDPGTAIDVIGRTVRVLNLWKRNGSDAPLVKFPHVHVVPLSAEDLFDDVFTPIARDGAGVVEVQIRLQKALGALAACGIDGYREAARKHSDLAFERASKALPIGQDLDLVRKARETATR
jgi:uncharacterized membrane protein